MCTIVSFAAVFRLVMQRVTERCMTSLKAAAKETMTCVLWNQKTLKFILLWLVHRWKLNEILTKRFLTIIDDRSVSWIQPVFQMFDYDWNSQLIPNTNLLNLYVTSPPWASHAPGFVQYLQCLKFSVKSVEICRPVFQSWKKSRK